MVHLVVSDRFLRTTTKRGLDTQLVLCPVLEICFGSSIHKLKKINNALILMPVYRYEILSCVCEFCK